MINEFNIQKSVAFPYTNNEVAERQIKKTIPFTVAPKIIKCLGINLTKEMKDLHSEDSKTLKEIEDDPHKWEDSPCSWVGRPNIIKMSILPRAIYHSMQSLSKYHRHFSQS